MAWPTWVRASLLAAPLLLLVVALCDHGASNHDGAGGPAKLAQPAIVSTTGVLDSSFPRPTRSLELESRHVEGRRYRLFGPGPAAHFRITRTRPDPLDPRLSLVVAGTYTSPDDEVEGLFMVDGVVQQERPKSWEGALTIVDARATLQRFVGGDIDAQIRTRLKSRRGSLLQGHLLVDGSTRLHLRDGPSVQRRAFVQLRERALVIESEGRATLGRFADDLVALGASRALNLDMGAWSEGWYRSSDGGRVILGDDHGATARQSNWLVIGRR
jgi:hypothetical protein